VSDVRQGSSYPFFALVIVEKGSHVFAQAGMNLDPPIFMLLGS
jgi:hypothetical protein